MNKRQKADQWHYKKQDEFRRNNPRASIRETLRYFDYLDRVWKRYLGIDTRKA